MHQETEINRCMPITPVSSQLMLLRVFTRILAPLCDFTTTPQPPAKALRINMVGQGLPPSMVKTC